MQDSKINIGEAALKVAVKQIGQCEVPVGSNSGPMVNKYLESVGLKPGAPWCMAFVYWCFERAAEAAGVKNPLVKTGGVMECWNKAGTNIKFFDTEALARPELIMPGDQFIMQFGKGTGHTGIVESMGPLIIQGKERIGKVIHTIEGNSNEDGSREGYEVVRHVRRLDDSHLLGFLKWI